MIFDGFVKKKKTYCIRSWKNFATSDGCRIVLRTNYRTQRRRVNFPAVGRTLIECVWDDFRRNLVLMVILSLLRKIAFVEKCDFARVPDGRRVRENDRIRERRPEHPVCARGWITADARRRNDYNNI